MLISVQEGFGPIQTNKTRRVSAAAGEKAKQADGCYDHLTVSSQREGGADFREMVSRLSHQVRTYNTTGKIQELRRQVGAGEYQIEPREIAARMLLVGGNE